MLLLTPVRPAVRGRTCGSRKFYASEQHFAVIFVLDEHFAVSSVNFVAQQPTVADFCLCTDSPSVLPTSFDLALCAQCYSFDRVFENMSFSCTVSQGFQMPVYVYFRCTRSMYINCCGRYTTALQLDQIIRVAIEWSGCGTYSYIPVSYTHLTLPTNREV